MMRGLVGTIWIDGISKLLELESLPLSRDYVAFSSRRLFLSRDVAS